MSESREHIRNRMLQHAAKIWGYPETEEASNFDPLVELLLSVNATELERLSNEIHHSRNRVMERIVQLLAPDVLTGPHLASAILNANSLDNSASLSEKEQFYFTLQTKETDGDSYQGTDLFFTPTAPYHINKSRVKYVATGNKIYRYSGNISRELVALAADQLVLSASTLWIGMDHPDVNLNNTQFYFQFRSGVNKAAFYNQLKNTSWSINNQKIATHNGYNIRATESADWYAEQVIHQKTSITSRYLKLINEQYEEAFLTISDDQNPALKGGMTGLPTEIAELFGTKIPQMDTEEIRWIKVTFPENISNAILEGVSVFSNSFPVVNRRLHEITYRVQPMINVIPLTSEDQFFDLAEISDETGRNLHIRHNNETDNSKMNILLRNGGAGRFDERDATVVIENLVQLLRDESASFAKLGKDLIAQEIKALQQSIAKMEQLIGHTDNQTSFTPYLMVRNTQKTGSRFLYTQYWSTAGYGANGLKSGTRLHPYKTGSVHHSSVMLLTHTHGGRNRLSQADSVIAYKYALLSKDRVMSREDISLFCKMFLGAKVKEVIIEKGFMISPETTKGFMKTIDITIKINKKELFEAREKGEVAAWEKDLAQQLAERSMAFIPFRVFIKEAA